MKTKKSIPLAMFAATIVLVTSCMKDKFDAPATVGKDLASQVNEKGQNPDELALFNDNLSSRRNGGHYVYIESNDSVQNRILVYEEQNDGSLVMDGMALSGGSGNGGGLGSQGAVVLDENHKWLYAVNAGSNSISSFKVNNDGSVTLKNTVSSYGTKPVSLCVRNSLLYVVNSGTSNIHGYTVSGNGNMSSITGSDKPLSASGAGPAQISFGPNGNWVVVTEKATNNITRYNLNGAGAAGAAITVASNGQTPFGFSFARDKFMIVSNAAGGAANAGSCTSYRTNGGAFNSINGVVANNQSAPCWVATTNYGRFAFVTNTASNNISSYYISEDGELYLVNGAAAVSGGGPIDLVVSSDNKCVYALCGVDHTIYQYKRTFLGGISSNGFIGGLPASAAGLAEY